MNKKQLTQIAAGILEEMSSSGRNFPRFQDMEAALSIIKDQVEHTKILVQSYKSDTVLCPNCSSASSADMMLCITCGYEFYECIAERDIQQIALRSIYQLLRLALTRLAAQCLLAAAECGTHNIMWTSIFERVFQAIDDVEYSDETFQSNGLQNIFEECIVTPLYTLINENNFTEQLYSSRLVCTAAQCILLLHNFKPAELTTTFPEDILK